MVGSYVGFNSFIDGSAGNGYDHTGAETSMGNSAGCGSSGSSCHNGSASPAIDLEIKVDSIGLYKTTYVAGKTYKITVRAVNQAHFGLKKFGFQAGVIKDSFSSPVPVNAGIIQTSNLDTGVSYYAGSANYRVNLVEAYTPLRAILDTNGGPGAVYESYFYWTAPVAKTGKVSIWVALAAVNNNNVQDAGDQWTTKHIVLQENRDNTAVNDLSSSLHVSAYPNPVASQLNILFSNVAAGSYNVGIHDLTGKVISTDVANVSGASATYALDAATWAPGVYIAVIEKDGARQSIQVIKN